MKALNKYFVIKSIPVQHKLYIVYNSLEGRAKFWFEIERNEFELNQFGLLNALNRHKIICKRIFLNKLEAQYFQPKMDAYELHYSVVQQMPLRVREALVAVDYADGKNIIKTLAQLD